MITVGQHHWQDRLPDNIFLTGKMGAGKDFLAVQLIAEAGFTRLSFADALKEEVAALHSISVDELNRRKAEFRADLQRIGVERRGIDTDYWLKEWARRRAAISGPVVVTDARFPNEAEYGIQIGALCVRINVADSVRSTRLRLRDGSFDPATLNHVSEAHIDTLPVHLEVSGELPADLYVPVLADCYRQMQIAYWRARPAVDVNELEELTK